MLALKPYIEKIRKHCDNLSKSDLINLLCQIAQEVPAKERHLFLEKMKVSQTKITANDHSKAAFDTQESDEILERIDELIEDVFERQESIEDGSFYDENPEYGGYYDEECPDGISEEQKEEVERFFLEADQLFLAGNLDLAGKVYQKLTGLFGHNSDRELYYDIDYYAINVNWREALARYCRCVYETSPANKRVEETIYSMEVGQSVFPYHYITSQKVLPSLKDVFEAKTGELTGWNDFLEDFKKKLKSKNDNRACLLYLEAVNWTDGLTGVALEVRKKKNPAGYLYWLDQLQADQSWHELAKAAQESLDNMPFDNLRAYAANKLSLVGEETENSSLVLQGKREQFFSTPEEPNLVSLLKESIKQDVKEAELKKVLEFLPSEIKKHSWKESDLFTLKIKVMLILGRLEEAYSKIDQKTFVGWSYGNQTGAIYASILFALTKGNSQANTIYKLLNNYLRNRNVNEDLIGNEIRQSLSKLAITESQKKEWFQFVQTIATARIDHIVSNQYRKAYARAAEAMGGYMECLILNNQKNEAIVFLDLNRNQKYKQFRAFREKVDNVLRESPLLNQLPKVSVIKP